MARRQRWTANHPTAQNGRLHLKIQRLLSVHWHTRGFITPTNYTRSTETKVLVGVPEAGGGKGGGGSSFTDVVPVACVRNVGDGHRHSDHRSAGQAQARDVCGCACEVTGKWDVTKWEGTGKWVTGKRVTGKWEITGKNGVQAGCQVSGPGQSV